MKKEFIKVKTDGFENLTEGKIYSVLSCDVWDMALVYLFFNDVGKLVQHHDWEDYWEDNFELINEEMTDREVMIFNSGISHGLCIAKTDVDEEYGMKCFERGKKKRKSLKEKKGYLWLDDGVEKIRSNLNSLYSEKTDHFYDSGDKDGIV